MSRTLPRRHGNPGTRLSSSGVRIAHPPWRLMRALYRVLPEPKRIAPPRSNGNSMAWLQSHFLWIQEFAAGLAVLQFDPPGKTIRLTREVLDELEAALTAVEMEARFRALLIRSLKPG